MADICTVFKDIYDKKEPHYVRVDTVLHHIKTGRWRDKIDIIRMTETKEERNRLKTYLPSVCFSGKFEERYDSKMIDHSGFVILDFDKISDIQEKKKEICADKYTYACFLSPSGDGLKALVKIPPIKEKHRSFYRGLVDKYSELDTTSRNESRVCYVSFDNELYLNKDSEIWDKEVNFKSEKEVVIAQDTDLKKMQICIDMIRNAADGEKHKELIKAARLAGGFIAGGYLEEAETIRYLELEINKRDIADPRQAQKTICDGVENGKLDPINDSNEKDRIKKIKEEIIIIEGEPSKDVIYLDDVRENILYSFNNPTSRGETTHFEKMDAIYRMARKEVTIFYGLANHGKSTFLYQIALLKSMFNGQKWAIFSPENYPAHEFYKDLIHMYVGKSPEYFHSNRMNEMQLKKAMDFVNKHFYFLYPEDEAPTPEYINMRFREAILKHNVDGCIIDPFNQLDNDIGKTGFKEHLYISGFLTKQKRFAVDNNIFMIIVAHPKGDVTLNNGNYDMPKPYSLSGGPMWINKSDNIVCVHRPNYSDWTDRAVVIASQKIKKQKLNGIPGEIYLEYDRTTNRYYDGDITPFDNKQDTQNSLQFDKKQMQPNIKFDEPKHEQVTDDELIGIEGDVPF